MSDKVHIAHSAQTQFQMAHSELPPSHTQTHPVGPHKIFAWALEHKKNSQTQIKVDAVVFFSLFSLCTSNQKQYTVECETANRMEVCIIKWKEQCQLYFFLLHCSAVCVAIAAAAE